MPALQRNEESNAMGIDDRFFSERDGCGHSSMRKIYSTENISANQRAWYEQRYNPPKCRACKQPIVFMKNHRWNYVPCDARKIIVNEGDALGSIAIMDAEGIVTTQGRRVGWPVHVCKAKTENSEPQKDKV
jgi:hypothetical protein